MPADPFFRMIVEDVFSIKGRGTVITGQIESGTLNVNDEIYLRRTNSSRRVVVTGIEMFRKLANQAQAGENVGILCETLPNKMSRREISCWDQILSSA